MANEALQQYIRDARASGMTEETIRLELGRLGWKNEDVNAAFASTAGGHANASAPSIPPKRRLKIKTIITALAVTLFIGGVGASAYFVLPNFLSKPPYAAESFLSDLISNVSRINSATYTVGLSVKMEPKTPGAKSLRDAFPEYTPQASASWQVRLDEPVITQMIRLEDLYFTYLPTEMNAALSVRGNAKKTEGEGITPLGNTAVSASFETPDFSMNADVEFIAADGKLFGKINRMPSILFFSFDKLKGRWILISDTASSSAISAVERLETEEEERLLEALRQMPKVADEVGLITVVGKPTKEKLGESAVYRYELRSNPERALEFYDRMVQIIRSSVPADNLEIFDEVTKEQRKVFADPTYVKLANHFQDQSMLSVLVEQQSKLPVKAESSAIFVPSIASQASNPKQLNIGLSFLLSEINEPVSVTAPAEYITLDAAYQLMVPQSAP